MPLRWSSLPSAPRKAATGNYQTVTTVILIPFMIKRIGACLQAPPPALPPPYVGWPRGSDRPLQPQRSADTSSCCCGCSLSMRGR